MNTQTETEDKTPVSEETNHRIPKRVWLAAWLAVLGAVMTTVVAIVNGGISSATHIWSVAAPCASIAGMIAVVCYAIQRYR